MSNEWPSSERDPGNEAPIDWEGGFSNDFELIQKLSSLLKKEVERMGQDVKLMGRQDLIMHLEQSMAAKGYPEDIAILIDDSIPGMRTIKGETVSPMTKVELEIDIEQPYAK